MQIKEAIILAGGLGTRLRSAVPELPKCLAPVNGKPFIEYVINYLKLQGVTQFLFSLGYLSNHFSSCIASLLPEDTYQLIIEKSPLGTGGAIKYAAKHAKSDQLIIVNGDSLFKANLAELTHFHFISHANCTLALKSMQQFDRYGTVLLDAENCISSFVEKKPTDSGLINGGVYVLNKKAFFQKDLPDQFSFEKDYLQKYLAEKKIVGLVQDAYFIDIGIPEDYQRAQSEIH